MARARMVSAPPGRWRPAEPRAGGGGAVAAEDRQRRPSPRRGEDARDEVGLRVVLLTVSLAGAGDVEVAKRDGAQPVHRVPGHGALEGELGGAVRADRAGGRVLADGHLLRVA